MAHHRLMSLNCLASSIRKSLSQCNNIAGQYAIFNSHVPHFASTYAAYNDLDWIKHVNFSYADVIKNTPSGYQKTRVPFTKEDDIFEIKLLSWAPDATTRIHMHLDYLATASTVIHGSLTETLYTHKIMDEDSKLYINYATQLITPGSTSIIDGNQLHSMHCDDNDMTYSLQICLKCPYNKNDDDNKDDAGDDDGINIYNLNNMGSINSTNTRTYGKIIAV